MTRPEIRDTDFLSEESEKHLRSSAKVVAPYIIGIVVMGVVAIIAAVFFTMFIENDTTKSVIIGSITLFSTNVIGYLLVLAKQVESDHRINSRMDQLLESRGLNEYQAGLKQGIKDAIKEIRRQRGNSGGI